VNGGEEDKEGNRDRGGAEEVREGGREKERERRKEREREIE